MAQNHGHGDSMTNSAQWGQVGENILLQHDWSSTKPSSRHCLVLMLQQNLFYKLGMIKCDIIHILLS